jgi:hypothetical protein
MTNLSLFLPIRHEVVVDDSNGIRTAYEYAAAGRARRILRAATAAVSFTYQNLDAGMSWGRGPQVG